MLISVKTFITNKQTREEEVRRFSIHKRTTLEEYVKILSSIVNPKSTFMIKYLDEEGDWVRISTNEEWQDALLHVDEKQIFKVQVEILPPPHSHNIHHDEQKMKEEPQSSFSFDQFSKNQYPFNKIYEVLQNPQLFQQFIQHPMVQQCLNSHPFAQQFVQDFLQNPQEALKSFGPLLQQICGQMPFGSFENSQPKEGEKVNDKELEEKMKLLEEMGFTDPQMNKELLLKFEGDLSKVIDEFTKM